MHGAPKALSTGKRSCEIKSLRRLGRVDGVCYVLLAQIVLLNPDQAWIGAFAALQQLQEMH